MALLPLESNPDVMNKYLLAMGVPEKWQVVDVFGLDPDALSWVPRPVLAVILLFPCSKQFYEHAEQQFNDLKDKGQELHPNIFYMKQYVSNACGTIALIHCVANNAERIGLQDGVFKATLVESSGLTPEERGMLLLKDDKADIFKFINVHQELAKEGQTEVNPNEAVNHHFIAFIEKGGYLYELDGRKAFPVNHGPTSEDTLLEDAAKVCREFMARDAEDVNFTVMALTASD